MKAAIIGASVEALHTIKKAKEKGIEIIALDGNPDAEGLAAADNRMVVNISDEQATIEILKQEKPDFVLTVPIGRYLTTIGAVNDALSLKGITKNAAILCTDKYKFHEKMNAAELRSCKCYLITEKDKKVQNAENYEIRYPAILKPRYGSGSRAILFIDNKEELSNALTEVQKQNEDFVLEEAAPGIEYGVDGAVTDGIFHFLLLREKINTPLPERQAVGYFSLDPQKDNKCYKLAKKYMEKTVKALGLDNCLLHADLMINGDNVFAIEVSARPSGHYLHNIFTPAATGVDEAEQYINFISGRTYNFEPIKSGNYLIHFWDVKEGIVKEVKRKETLILSKDIELVDFMCTINPGDYMEKVTGGHSLMGRGYFILKGNSKEELKTAAENIKKQLLIQ